MVSHSVLDRFHTRPNYRDPVEVTTTEEKPVDVRTPLDEAVQLVTTVIDDAKNLVRVRIFKSATGRPTAGIKGDLVDEVQVALGATVQTTKLPVNFLVTVTRIGNRSAR